MELPASGRARQKAPQPVSRRLAFVIRNDGTAKELAAAGCFCCLGIGRKCAARTQNVVVRKHDERLRNCLQNPINAKLLFGGSM